METPSALVPAYVLALFEDPPAPAPAPAPPNPVTPAPTPQPRDDGGRFTAAEVAAQRELETARARIEELNRENMERRKENKELKDSHTATAAQIAASNQRAIRGEVRAALVLAKAHDTDVLDLVLKHAGDKIKIDDATGEIVGVNEAVAAYKAAKPKFFEAEPEQLTPEQIAQKKIDDDAAAAAAAGGGTKPNATGGGSSVNGGANAGAGTVNGLPDLRGLSKEERKAALATYERSVRSEKNR